MTHRNVALTDFLTVEELNAMLSIYNTDPQHFRQRITDEIIRPLINRINADLGQLNDPDFLAYAVEYVFLEMERGRNG